MHVPKNVLWFEVLLYSSLTLDALSVAFQDRTPTAELTERTIFVMTVMDGLLILLLVFLVWLAAQRRKSWPRWVLALSRSITRSTSALPAMVRCWQSRTGSR